MYTYYMTYHLHGCELGRRGRTDGKRASTTSCIELPNCLTTFMSAMYRVGLAPNQYTNMCAELFDLAEVPDEEPVARPTHAYARSSLVMAQLTTRRREADSLPRRPDSVLVVDSRGNRSCLGRQSCDGGTCLQRRCHGGRRRTRGQAVRGADCRPTGAAVSLEAGGDQVGLGR